jgi:hypothetical protein
MAWTTTSNGFLLIPDLRTIKVIFTASAIWKL